MKKFLVGMDSANAQPNTSLSGMNMNRKRRYFDDDEKEDEGISAPKVLIEETSLGLPEFCDEILLEIFKNLDSNSIYHIGNTCQRFLQLVSDRRLWKNIDLTSEKLERDEVAKRLKHINKDTRNISLRGLTEDFPNNGWNHITLGSSLLKDMADICENLQSLELHHCYLDFKHMAITDFPKGLLRLVFNNCYIKWAKTQLLFFTRIDNHLTHLEELYLEYCNWFETHDLVLFSKLPELRKLSLRGCVNMKDCVPYGSIATRFGFKKLEYLDVRDTLISDSDIQCFNIAYSLKELLLECPVDIREMENINAAEQSQQQRETPPSRPSRHLLIPAGIPHIANNQDDNNIVEIIIHDRSLMNRVERPAPNVQDADRVGGSNDQPRENQPNRQVPDINRAISQSLWFERRYPPPFSPPRIYPISDRGILCFGAPRNVAQGNIVWIRAEPRPPNNNLERLTVRHYRLVTDTSLTHLSHCSPRLVYLDLTGTAVTRAGIENFKEKKPECYIISDHFTG